MSKYKVMFLTEAREHLQKMSAQLVTVEADPSNQNGIDALFRQAHSIKGMAASMGFMQTAGLAHHLEDTLDLFRQKGHITPEAIDSLLAGVDLLEALLEDIDADREERKVEEFYHAKELRHEVAEVADAGTVSPTVVEEKFRLQLSLHDKVVSPAARFLVILRHLSTLGKVLTSDPTQEQILRGGVVRHLDLTLQTSLDIGAIKACLKNYSEISNSDVALPETKPAAQGAGSAGATVRVGTDLLDRFISLTGELITSRYMLQSAAGAKDWGAMKDGLGRLARLVKDLHHQVLQVRMMPIDTVTGRLPRLVRDLSRKSNKDIRLELEGTGIELDRSILEELTDPLVHMVRNAIDHGIEQKGTITVRAWRQRDQVMLQVADNGAGMNPETLRRRAFEKGLISQAQLEAMRDYDALQLICLPGFSTAPQVTETSGRGVGMDVVKSAVEKLGGVLHIDAVQGRGTRFTLKLPLSVAIIKVLLLHVDGKQVALPITRVLQTIEVDRHQIQISGKQRVFSHHEELLPLISLRKILNLPIPKAAEFVAVVVTEVLGRKIGLVVDGFSGQREVFVQKVPSPVDRLHGLGGGTILGDGRIVFILDIQGLLERRR
ncbi:chemotaxis protein CheA [Geopsychrobacter electrodiphilus]|uniref:chemotaxis protein CheA n=1 Tax=Geopsychrobacter electrodiphilus TaxID=225196 RepID=UPI00035E53DF|nr:chemotaxis protein CheA [Geopsychrobacter electrodiphilus]